MRSVDVEESELYVGSSAFAFKEAAESSDRLSAAVRDHYRCPANFFDFALRGPLSRDQGYFRFGERTTCYGHSCSGSRKAAAKPSLYDAFWDTVVDEGRLGLPFNPTEIIDNLRLERYANSHGAQNFLRKLYYLFRPLTNRAVRRQVQKFHVRNWREFSFPQWPVDTTVENLCETLMLLSMQAKHLDRVPFVWFWPRGANGCVMMTHDVENQEGRDSCADVMNVDDAFGIKASFQIVPEKRYPVSLELLETVRSRGFEVGVQDLNHDGQLYDDREEFVRRAGIINRYGDEFGARGFRSAVLYRKPEWYGALDFSFDMSIPNVAHLDPQRGGCCTVMPYFIGDILELPVTTTQDYALFHLLNERSIDLWKTQVDLILHKNGLASFIVHPDYVMEDDTKSVYEDLLSYLRDLHRHENIWFALPSEVDSWWRARSKMSVVRDGNLWRIEGEGGERAVLAYAKNIDGKVVYELEGAAGAT
jgi:hypothetical protein